jgi:hypothetical protein
MKRDLENQIRRLLKNLGLLIGVIDEDLGAGVAALTVRDRFTAVQGRTASQVRRRKGEGRTQACARPSYWGQSALPLCPPVAVAMIVIVSLVAQGGDSE